ncbi:S9 family peptidase [Bosea sp. (in: a-proteobacteria)]|uniref:alpha/beta hydrolase family protein n=1 Tax=Bosea sp. (in: a-proteobacteria) TaxID=1871050 RepID=UPI0027331CCC|nr:dienelactone hydrolase family protein [Bosea sp. (in: a-proteobacteria)]MDP3411452.1 dienelactone hydrolase family protein [Bosea sp. (in: a-proteobacteria)]
MFDRRTALLGMTGAMLAANPPAADARSAVTIDRVQGAGTGRRPLVVLLHGADGVTRRAQYQFAAQILAAQGYTVLFPHYFEVTGDRRASYSEIGSNYPVWRGGIGTVIDQVLEDPTIDASRLALVGISLGGALALSLAARDRRIKAVISYFGFRPGDLDEGRPQAPTLILHGDADRVVPVRNAAQIETLLRARGVPVETQIYPGEGHGFSHATQVDAATRSVAFLRRHLGA